MQKNISGAMFHSLLFAMGGAPTIAMIMIQSQPHQPAEMYQIFIGLSVIIACVLVPIILIQNAFLFFKRHSAVVEKKVEPLFKVYLGLNVLCLVYWIAMQFMG